MCLSHTTKLKNLSLLSHPFSFSFSLLSLSLKHTHTPTHTHIKTECITNNRKGEPVKKIHKEATPFVRSADKNLTSISVIYGSKMKPSLKHFWEMNLGRINHSNIN